VASRSGCPEEVHDAQAWAGQKSFPAKALAERGPRDGDPGNPTVHFHGEQRTNDTHQSTTDPQARLYKKSAVGRRRSSVTWATC